MKKVLMIFFGVTLILLFCISVDYAQGQKRIIWTVPGDFPTIQDAISSGDVLEGHTIMVGPGYHAGATVTKAVEIKGEENAIINDGPLLYPFLRAGFLIAEEVGTGATISHFRFECTPQYVRVDDGMLDFPIFSRGANNVTIEHCVMLNSLQAITNWYGCGWKISHNNIEGLYTLGGGGIGIFVGSRDNTPPADYNLIAYNKIEADVSQVLAFSTPGIALMSRYSTGGQVQNNRIIHNTSCVTGPQGVGFELTDNPLKLNDPIPPPQMVTGNKIGFNDFRGSTYEIAINPPEAGEFNTMSRNLGENRGHGLHPTVFK